jgi:glyoxylase-like metal-dependent hydrolase (beta-lactamase superfamily II)
MRIDRVLANNPGPYTGPGTNTYVVGDDVVVVIDPGPVDADHRRAIEVVIGDRRPGGVLVTHTHPDHAPLANPLARGLGVPALGHRPGPEFEPDVILADGDSIGVAGIDLVAIHTPGHSDDHLCLRLGSVLFTGDHIMGGSSVMVDDLTAYLVSLARLSELELTRLYPGHGPEIDSPAAVISWYIAHRLQREREILAAVGSGAGTVADVVAVVYHEVDAALHLLAARSVEAHLVKLASEGRVMFDRRSHRVESLETRPNPG